MLSETHLPEPYLSGCMLSDQSSHHLIQSLSMACNQMFLGNYCKDLEPPGSKYFLYLGVWYGSREKHSGWFLENGIAVFTWHSVEDICHRTERNSAELECGQVPCVCMCAHKRPCQ